MSAWTNGNYTKKGLSLLTKLTQGSSLKITRAVTGTGYVNPSALADQTGVTGIKQTLLFKAASYPETGVCKLPMFITNEGLATGYKAKQIGLYALDPDEGEILYFIAQSEAGTDVPSETDMPEYSSTWSFYFRYGQADNVNVTVDPSHTINEDMLNEVRIIAETGVSTPKLGEVLSLENTANLPFANLRILGKTTQNGTPTPDHPVSLVSAGASGSVNVRVYGKNLLAYPYEETTTTKNGLTFTDNGDGSVTVSGTATTTTFFKFSDLPKINGTIMVKGCPAGGSYSAYSLSVDKDGANLKYEYGNFVLVECDESATYSLSITIRKDATVNATFRPQACIYDSTTPPDYEKFKPAQTLAVSTPNGLPGIPVASGGNYRDESGQEWICDEIDLARGVYIQRVGKKTLVGTETWNKRNDYNVYTTKISGFDGGWTYHKAISSHFQCHYSKAYNGEVGYFALDEYGISYFASNETTVDDFKAWLTSNNVTVVCALQTPVETPLIYSEIAAFEALKSNNPHTTIINDGGANMEADCFLAQHEAAFKRLVDAKSITHGGVTMGLVFDGTTWRFNDDTTELDKCLYEQNLWEPQVKFECNGKSYYQMVFNDSSNLYYGNYETHVYKDGKWVDEAYKTITNLSLANEGVYRDTFMSYLKKMATPVPASAGVQVGSKVLTEGTIKNFFEKGDMIGKVWNNTYLDKELDVYGIMEFNHIYLLSFKYLGVEDLSIIFPTYCHGLESVIGCVIGKTLHSGPVYPFLRTNGNDSGMQLSLRDSNNDNVTHNIVNGDYWCEIYQLL